MFGEHLRFLRSAHTEKSQTEVARLLFIDRSTYSKYELGQTEPSIETLKRISEIFGISVDCLVYWEYNKFIQQNDLENAFSKKHDILLRYLDILKDNKIDIPEEEYEDFKKFNSHQSIIKSNKEIEENNNYINRIMDNNEKLLKNESIININKELNEINITINGGKKYYNDNLVIYNHLCNAFPSNLIAKLKRYKEI